MPSKVKYTQWHMTEQVQTFSGFRCYLVVYWCIGKYITQVNNQYSVNVKKRRHTCYVPMVCSIQFLCLGKEKNQSQQQHSRSCATYWHCKTHPDCMNLTSHHSKPVAGCWAQCLKKKARGKLMSYKILVLRLLHLYLICMMCCKIGSYSELFKTQFAHVWKAMSKSVWCHILFAVYMLPFGHAFTRHMHCILSFLCRWYTTMSSCSPYWFW